MRRKILGLVLGSALAVAAIAPAAAQTQCAAPQRGGAAGLVALVANVNVSACEIDVSVLNNSLNNLLQNADIHVLENILNNSPFLNDVTVTVVGGDLIISVLSGPVVTITGL